MLYLSFSRFLDNQRIMHGVPAVNGPFTIEACCDHRKWWWGWWWYFCLFLGKWITRWNHLHVLFDMMRLWYMRSRGITDLVDSLTQLFLLRAAGFLLPCYIIAWAISVIQRRRQRQVRTLHRFLLLFMIFKWLLTRQSSYLLIWWLLCPFFKNQNLYGADQMIFSLVIMVG